MEIMVQGNVPRELTPRLTHVRKGVCPQLTLAKGDRSFDSALEANDTFEPGAEHIYVTRVVVGCD